MKFRLIFILILAGGLYWPARADIYGLIRQGKIEEARREIEASSTVVRRDGSLLFYQALLEKSGEESFKFLEAAFKAELSPQYLEEDIYLMAQYYLARNDWGKVVSMADAYLQHWESGKYRNEVLRLAGLAHEKLDENERAESYRTRLIKENQNGHYALLGDIDRARILYGARDYSRAQKICRQIRNSDNAEAAVPALYMLSHYAIEQKRVDDAILYYNILKEGYPHAIGLDDLIDRFSQFERTTDDHRAERITGTVYSVQVGVFSIEKNAREMAERMKQYGQKVEIKDKIISDKKYHVVYVGRFVSAEEAMAFKTRLELSEKEVFQVIAR
nr:SPOR domain-containing protein [candidate division Zixibacteria bacterium]